VTEAEAVRFAERTAEVCARALTEATVILHGSLALGDFVPGRSDVDLLAVAVEPPAEAQTDEIVAAVADAPGRFDLRVVTRKTAWAPSPEPRLELAVGLHGEALEIVRSVNERDAAVELSMCRAAGRSLTGAAPKDVIAPVPGEWVLAAGETVLDSWQQRAFEAQYGELMVFTACRIWRFREEAVHCSKSDAAAWALARDPELRVVADALASRARPSHVPLDERGVRHLLARVLRRLRQPGGDARG
jgi:Nucleotidyltransferase domain/Domain of unknown function (DUF4111)